MVFGGSRGIGSAIVSAVTASGAAVRFTYAGSKPAADALAAKTKTVAIHSDAADGDASSVPGSLRMR
jgi:cyclic-di-GMP-binding biofilm dispersal mediator protein